VKPVVIEEEAELELVNSVASTKSGNLDWD
jgi:hypothetical protein